MSSILSTRVCAVGTHTTSLPGWPTRGSKPGCCASATPSVATTVRPSAADERTRYGDNVMLQLRSAGRAHTLARVVRGSVSRASWHSRVAGGAKSPPTDRLLRHVAVFRAPLGQEKVGLVGPPSVTDPEIEPGRIGPPVDLAEPLLVPAREDGDRPQVFSKRPQAPFVGLEEAHRNAGVVLHQGDAAVEQEPAHFREAVGMQQVRGALEEGLGDAELLAELEEAGALQAMVGHIGLDVVERLLLAAGPRGEDDFHARHRVAGAGRHDLALRVDAD